MNCGKLTETIYERSVIKVVKANSIENRKFYDGVGLGADCAILADETSAGIVSGQALASGKDKKVIVRAYLAAVNHVIACCANGAAAGMYDAYANITVVVPEKLREIKVRAMVEAVSVQAEETGIPILSCNIQALQSIGESIVTCVVNAGLKNKSNSTSTAGTIVDEDIVMTKWSGLEGTAVIAQGHYDKLCERYPVDIVDEAVDFYRYLSVVPEAATAVKSGASYLHVLREGGVYGALWEMAAEKGVGLVVDLKRIPIRQETVEVCEFFDLNPYELLAGGSLLITTQNGGELVRALKESGVPAAVIGRTVQGRDRIIRHGEESRFLEPANGDELYRLKKMEEFCNEGTNIINYRKEQQD